MCRNVCVGLIPLNSSDVVVFLFTASYPFGSLIPHNKLVDEESATDVLDQVFGSAVIDLC